MPGHVLRLVEGAFVDVEAELEKLRLEAAAINSQISALEERRDDYLTHMHSKGVTVDEVARLTRTGEILTATAP